jgi:hypothetical protein
MPLLNMPRRRGVLVAGFGLFLTGLFAQAEPVSEDQLKAAFVYNFAKFVDWSHLPEDKKTLVFGVLGGRPLKGELYRLAGKTVGDRKVEVVDLSEQTLSNCDLVFIGKGVPRGNGLAGKALKMMRLLTVSDREGFVGEGGLIELYRLKAHIRYDLRAESLAQKGLKVNARLLSMAAPRNKR